MKPVMFWSVEFKVRIYRMNRCLEQISRLTEAVPYTSDVEITPVKITHKLLAWFQSTSKIQG